MCVMLFLLYICESVISFLLIGSLVSVFVVTDFVLLFVLLFCNRFLVCKTFDIKDSIEKCCALDPISKNR